MSRDALVAAHEAFAQARHVHLPDEPIRQLVKWRIGALEADVLSAVEMLSGSYDAARAAVRGHSAALARQLVGKKGRKKELEALLDAIDGLIGETIRQAAEAERARKQTGGQA